MSVLIQFLQNNNTESISETGFILAKSDHDTAVPQFYNFNRKSYHNYNVIVSSIQSVNLFSEQSWSIIIIVSIRKQRSIRGKSTILWCNVQPPTR